MVCPFLYGGNRDAPNFAKLCAIQSIVTFAKKTEYNYQSEK